MVGHGKKTPHPNVRKRIMFQPKLRKFKMLFKLKQKWNTKNKNK